MTQQHRPNDSGLLTEQLLNALQQNNPQEVKILVERLVPEEIAEILEATPIEQRHELWNLIAPNVQGEILAHTNDEVTSNLLEQLNQHEILEAVEDLETDEITDIAQALPDDEQKKFIENLSDEDRNAVKTALSYPEESAGGVMSTDLISVREDVTLEVVLRLLRKMDELPDSMIDLIVRDRDNHYIGVLKINDLLTHDEDTLVSQIVDRHKAAKFLQRLPMIKIIF